MPALNDEPALVAGAVVRRAIARAWLEEDVRPGEGDVAERLGEIILQAHQRDAVERIRALCATSGGALLADPVGLGKTYVALALLRDAASPLVVAPAALRGMWREAMRRSGTPVPIISFEALSRGHAPPVRRPDLLVVDEAHHARNPATRRWRALASVAGHARVLLISATPVHNRRTDLVALFSLFLGAEAAARDDDELATLIVRRTGGALRGAPRPEVAPSRRLDTADDASTLDAILALPPPVPPADGGMAGALVAHGLVRQWASSQGALRAAVDRRLGRALALEASLEGGRHPTRAELRAWRGGEGAVQLAFPELMAVHAGSVELLESVRAHATALRTLRRRLEAQDADDARAAVLLEICAAHPGEKVVAFTQLADTVGTLFHRLHGRVRAAALTAGGALVAGGRLSRREVIARFAPVASGVDPPRSAERIDLLLTTDLLSEGVSLHDASVVVHLDRPWTPARMEQRVGRVARLGSAHRRIAVYELAPPASAETLLRTEALLAAKLRDAATLVGAPEVTVLPGMLSATAAPSASARREALRARLERWRAVDAGSGAEPPSPLVASVRGARDGLLVAARIEAVVLAGRPDGGVITSAPALLEELCAHAEGPDVATDAESLRAALREATEWLRRRQAALDAGVSDAGVASARRRILARLAELLRRAPAHLRPRFAALAECARARVMARMGAAAERRLGALAEVALPDEAWLLEVVDEVGSGGQVEPAAVSVSPDLLALILVSAPAA